MSRRGGAARATPRITPSEVAYLYRGLADLFPFALPQPGRVLSTFSGYRPIVAKSSRKAACSASRDHAIWEENGLVTVAGGKLTTSQSIAIEVLMRIRHRYPGFAGGGSHGQPLDSPTPSTTCGPLSAGDARGIQERYGTEALVALSEAPRETLGRARGLPIRHAEISWAIQREGARTLDDLMLRRFRIGLTTGGGGAEALRSIRPSAQPAFGWDDARWETEVSAYLSRWRREYGPPSPAEWARVFRSSPTRSRIQMSPGTVPAARHSRPPTVSLTR